MNDYVDDTGPDKTSPRLPPSSEVGSGSAAEDKWRILMEQQNLNFLALLETMKSPTVSQEVYLPEFCPDQGNVDACAWLSTADMCIAENPLSGAPLMIALSKALKGQASAWLSQISFTGMTWKDFSEAFVARYDSPETATASVINLFSSKPKDGECLANYATTQINLLMSRWKKLSTEQIAIATVMAHLSQVEPRVNRIAFTTEINTRSKLQQELKVLSYLKRKTTFPNADRASEVPEIKRPRFIPPSNVVKCIHCEKMGHHVSVCRFRKDFSQGFSRASREEQGNVIVTKPSTSGAVTCYNCGTTGHYASRCPQPKKSPFGDTTAGPPTANS